MHKTLENGGGVFESAWEMFLEWRQEREFKFIGESEGKRERKRERDGEERERGGTGEFTRDPPCPKMSPSPVLEVFESMEREGEA